MTLPRINATSRIQAGDGAQLETIFDTDLVRYNPLTELTNFRRNVNTLLDSVVRPGAMGFTATWGPAVDVYEKNGKYHVEFAVPGLKKDDIEIEANDNSLTVSAKTKEDKGDESARYHYREIRSTEFSRTIKFPQEIDANQATASYDNGILSISVPSVKPAVAKKVTIKG
jgi:HSP20 family protein